MCFGDFSMEKRDVNAEHSRLQNLQEQPFHLFLNILIKDIRHFQKNISQFSQTSQNYFGEYLKIVEGFEETDILKCSELLSLIVVDNPERCGGLNILKCYLKEFNFETPVALQCDVID